MRWSLLVLFLLLVPKQAFAWCVARTCQVDEGEACERDEEGCATSGEYLSWKEMPVQYRFDQAGTEKLDTMTARQVIRRAFETWSSAECEDGRTALRFLELDPVYQNADDRANWIREPFTIHFRDDAWPYVDEDNTLAKTWFTHTKQSGYFRAVAMEINTNKTEFALTDAEDGYDLQSVVTHEVGHWIGVAHSGVAGSIMQPHYCQSDKRCGGKGTDRTRALSDDDIAVVCALYPPGPEPKKSSCAMTPVPESRSHAGLLLAALALALPLARRLHGATSARSARGSERTRT